MLLFRFILFGMLGAAAISFAFYLGTGQLKYRTWGVMLLKWAVVAGLGFFGLMILGRIL
ncbi:MAG TPA: hypothetical protein VFY31_07945 [Macromonas sp.]|nr:hypothetical protein [Macromonas sp.]